MERTQYGLPGAHKDANITPEEEEMLLSYQSIIGDNEIKRASQILQEYKRGKSNLEKRVVEDELWWEGRHWEAIGKKRDNSPEVTSGWMFNAVINKHADMMDNYPEPVVLPREQSDEQSAKVLSEILPVVLECNDYEDTYSQNAWEKIKHGTSVTGVFWNSEKENGLGDIDIRTLDILNIFWQPGITDIQKSRNLFITELVDNDVLLEQYPQTKGKLGNSTVDVTQYIYDDSVDTSNKSLVVDWYYKTRNAAGKTILHYVKYVNDVLLFASENEPEYRNIGWYDHGLYPVVLDTMYPEKGTPMGFGIIAVCKNPQIYIDALSANILQSSMIGTRKRYFVSESTAINEDEFLDANKPLVHVAGEITDAKIQEIVPTPPSSAYLTVLEMKIDEMKETSANKDVNSGSSQSGVTAAAAIAALQEAGNKNSRDIISVTYKANVEICRMCVELIRQFYDETRSFRVTGPQGVYEFVDFNNAQIKDQPLGVGADGSPLYRRPVFDLKIKAQKTNPFSRIEQNENAKQLYQMGFFNPDRAQEALNALDMMQFEGIDKVRERVEEGQTLMNICQQMQNQIAQLSAMVGLALPQMQTQEAPMQAPMQGIGQSIQDAQAPMTSYGERLAKRSIPDMDAVSDAAMPR